MYGEYIFCILKTKCNSIARRLSSPLSSYIENCEEYIYDISYETRLLLYQISDIGLVWNEGNIAIHPTFATKICTIFRKFFEGNKTRSANVLDFSMYDHSEDILCTLDMLSLRNTKYPSTNALFTFTANMSIRIYMK